MNNYKIFRGGGVLIRPFDSSDLGIASFNPRDDKIVNEEFCLPIPEKQIVIDQTVYNSCVGHSLCICESLLQYKKTNKWINFDPYVIYGTVKAGQYRGEGMYPAEPITNCTKEGFYFKRDFGIEGERPGIINTVESFKRSNPDLVKQAGDYNFSSRAAIYNSEGVKKALTLGMPVTATWFLYPSFFETGADGMVRIPSTSTEKMSGSHQMTIVGWRSDRRWIVINSWGDQYGFKGLYYIPFDYSFNQAFAVADDIMPTKYKAKKIELGINDDIVDIDGTNVKIDSAPVIMNDRTYLPIRVVTEALGSSVSWNQEKQEVTIRSEEAKIVLHINDKNYTVDNKPMTMDVVPIILNDRTMLPIRFIAEALNCDVEWVPEYHKVVIKCL